jgi:hypothetical protein
MGCIKRRRGGEEERDHSSGWHGRSLKCLDGLERDEELYHGVFWAKAYRIPYDTMFAFGYLA